MDVQLDEKTSLRQLTHGGTAQVKRPAAPKPVTTAFTFFSMAVRTQLAAEMTELMGEHPSSTNIKRAVGAKWLSSTEAQRAEYEDKARADKKRFDTENHLFVAAKKELQLQRKPARKRLAKAATAAAPKPKGTQNIRTPKPRQSHEVQWLRRRSTSWLPNVLSGIDDPDVLAWVPIIEQFAACNTLIPEVAMVVAAMFAAATCGGARSIMQPQHVDSKSVGKRVVVAAYGGSMHWYAMGAYLCEPTGLIAELDEEHILAYKPDSIISPRAPQLGVRKLDYKEQHDRYLNGG